MRYKADITVGSLKQRESRLIADLLLREADADGWNDAIVKNNVLRARSPATAKRLANLIRRRLETMGPDLWELVRGGTGIVATHAVFAADGCRGLLGERGGVQAPDGHDDRHNTNTAEQEGHKSWVPGGGRAVHSSSSGAVARRPRDD